MMSEEEIDAAEARLAAEQRQLDLLRRGSETLRQRRREEELLLLQLANASQHFPERGTRASNGNDIGSG